MSKVSIQVQQSQKVEAHLLILSFATAFVFMIIGETFSVSGQVSGSSPSILCAMLHESLSSGFLLFFPLWLIVIGSAVARALFANKRNSAKIVFSATAVANAFYAYSIIMWDRTLRGFVPLIILFVLLAAFLFISYLILCNRKGDGRRRLLTLGIAIVGFLGAVASHILNYDVLKGGYAKLHTSILVVSLLLLHVGCLAVLMQKTEKKSSTRVAHGLLLLFVIAVGSSWFIRTADGSAIARPAFSTFTLLGHASSSFRNYSFKTEVSSGEKIPPNPEAVNKFSELTGMPSLQGDFTLENQNIVFITVESFREDSTSVHDSTLGTTPNLATLVQNGAFVFEDAYSPSSGTLHSLSGIMSMTYPSLSPVETWDKSWHGELGKEAVTAAELLAEAGWETMRISHDYRGCFKNRILGLDQGFEHESFVEEWCDEEALKTDAELGNIIADAIKARKQSGKFFAWIFFSAPHSHYIPHGYENMPSDTDHERYLQEVRFVDDQLGKIITELKQNGMFDNTIMIVTGDHGEEFGDHGGAYHKATVYTEVTRVPLIVLLPGVKGEIVKAPVSTMYTFPWLFLQSNGVTKKRAQDVISQQIGPMLKETDNAVVGELLGHDRMQSALIWPNDKLNYDFISERIEYFDTQKDPGEKSNLLFTDPKASKKREFALERYREIRATLRKANLNPNKSRTPIPENERGLPSKKIPPP